MSSVAARLEARAASTAAGTSVRQDNATVGSSNHAEVTEFLRAFEAGKKNLENELSAILYEKESSVKGGSDDTTIAALKAKLALLNPQLTALQRAMADHAHLLTAYDLRATKIQLGVLEESLARTADTIAPRKKFAFKKKTQPAAATAIGAANAADAVTSSAAAAAPAVPAIAEQLPPEDPLTGFYRKEGLILVKSGGSVTGKDVMLTHLRNCVVFILDRPSALRCHDLVGCHVYVGPCSGSVLIYGATDSTFHMATRQLRIHDTHRTTFHLHALSSPIVEHTDTSGFAAYDFAYPNIDEDLRQSGFEGTTSRHATVEDFNWLRAQQSPNWYALLPEQNHRAPVRLTAEQTSRLVNMTDDQPSDDAQQAQLKQIAQEARII